MIPEKEKIADRYLSVQSVAEALACTDRNVYEVNDRRVNATASQATHEIRSSTLTLEGGFPALERII